MSLKEFRESQNLTADEMAARIEVSKSLYYKVESGERNPSHHFLMKFKKAFPNGNIDNIFFN